MGLNAVLIKEAFIEIKQQLAFDTSNYRDEGAINDSERVFQLKR